MFIKYKEDVIKLRNRLKNDIKEISNYIDIREIKQAMLEVNELMDDIRPELVMQEKLFICNEVEALLYHVKSISYDLKSLTQPSDMHENIISRLYDSIRKLLITNRCICTDIDDNMFYEYKYNIDSNIDLKSLFNILNTLKEIFDDIINNENIIDKLDDIINDVDDNITCLQEELFDLKNLIM